MLSWLLQPMEGEHIARFNRLHAQSQGKPLSEMASIDKQIIQKPIITPERLGNGEKLGELLKEYEKSDKTFGNENNLNLNKVIIPKNQHQLIAFWGIALLIFSMLGVLLFYMRRYKVESKKLYDTNKKLSHVQNHFENIVRDRTHDLATMLEKSQKSNQLKSTFLANITHEIRTPLNGIIDLTRSLSKDNLCFETRKQYLDNINREGVSLLQITNDLITISKIDAGQVQIKNEPFNLNQLFYDLFSTFNSNTSHRKRDGVELKLNLPLSDSHSNIVSDALRIEQILINLIDNALKFTYKGSVEFGYTMEDNDSIKIIVKDTGIGIPNDGHENIFCRFNRESMASPYNSSGTGLGLPICKGLVDLLKGNIWFDSQPDKGTSFYFSIPYLEASPNEQSYTSGLSSSFPNLNFKGKKILVVEDDLFSFQFIEALLQNTNAKIIHAKNGEDAVEISSIASDIDLVIMDICLPFLDGCEATIQIKKQNPKICVIAQTANVHNNDRARCMRAGCDDYIAKPLDPDEFLRLVAHYLKKAEANRHSLSDH
jgi:signal transduction histidine kinase/ActR/RegA family two-component response regulator